MKHYNHWLILKTNKGPELIGPFVSNLEAVVRAKAFTENTEVKSSMILNQDQLVTLLELITDTLVD